MATPKTVTSSPPTEALKPTLPRSTVSEALREKFALYDKRKHHFERVIALVLFVGLSPLLVVVCLAIVLDSRGWPIYRQWRKGRYQVPFQIYKFRTMVDGAHGQRESLFAKNEVDGILFKMSDDPRVTRLGSWLRKLSIDELPQLLNVVKGEMSLIGPRPFSIEVFDRAPVGHAIYEDWLLQRHQVLPGLTGLWQVCGRNQRPFRQLMQLDLFYIQHRWLGLDLEILWRTFFAVVTSKGAH